MTNYNCLRLTLLIISVGFHGKDFSSLPKYTPIYFKSVDYPLIIYSIIYLSKESEYLYSRYKYRIFMGLISRYQTKVSGNNEILILMRWV